MALHVTAAGAGGAPPIPAKKPFIFRDMRFLLRRSYLILRELGCRYLCTKELRVFLDENETTLGREPLTLSLYLRLCANGGINLQTIFGGFEGGWLGFEVSHPCLDETAPRMGHRRPRGPLIAIKLR